jgi:hypothetical protein
LPAYGVEEGYESDSLARLSPNLEMVAFFYRGVSKII